MRMHPAVAALAVVGVLLGTACDSRNNDTSQQERELASGVFKAAHAHYAAELLAAHGDDKRALRATNDYLELAGAATLGLSDGEVANILTLDAVAARRVCAPCAREIEEAAAQIRKPGEFGTTTG